jgi:hypothetical protein
MSKRYRDNRERYVKLRLWALEFTRMAEPAQRHAPSTSRWSSDYNGSNNGRIVIAVRDAAKFIAVSKDTAQDRRLEAIRHQLRPRE